MRIWRFHEFGKVENLTLEQAPVPTPAEGEAVVKLHYAALNPADAFLVMNQYPGAGTPPLAVGRDGAGVIETPARHGRFAKGDAVVVLRSAIGVTRDGTLAEYVAVPEQSLAPLPEGWTPQEGAAAPLVFLTAWQALVTHANIMPGQTVLVTGGSGGVGTASVLLARAFGAIVIATSRSEEKRNRLLELGADAVIDSSSPHYVEDVKNAMSGGRADIVVENLGGIFLQHSIDLVRPCGHIAVVGLLAGLRSEIVLGKLIFKRARIQGVSVGAFTAEEAQEAWRQIVKRLASIGRRPPIDQIFPMQDVHEAFARLGRGPMGKVLVDVTA